MKALKLCFPVWSFITLAENFGKWRPYLELFWAAIGRPKISLGGRGPLTPLKSPMATAEPARVFVACCHMVYAVVQRQHRLVHSTTLVRRRTIHCQIRQVSHGLVVSASQHASRDLRMSRYLSTHTECNADTARYRHSVDLINYTCLRIYIGLHVCLRAR